jgi:hypothetical protein
LPNGMTVLNSHAILVTVGDLAGYPPNTIFFLPDLHKFICECL